jgi:hypothetical protein
VSDELKPLKYPPGLYRNGTKYQSMGRWYEANLIRFLNDTIGPVGGWRRALTDAQVAVAPLVGVPRGVIAWSGASGNAFVGFGTTSKLNVLTNGSLYDVTPAGFVAGRVDTGYVTATGAFGQGAFGAGAFGVGSVTSALAEADVWSFDTFGDYLVGVATSTKKLYVWDGNTANVAAVPAGAPATCDSVVVTPERFLMVLGANGNVRRVQWPSQESTTDWTDTPLNSAGDFDLSTEGRLMCGKRTKSETLIWTSTDLWAAIYIGGKFIYRFAQRGEKCGIISRRAAVTVDTRAYWMGRKNFYVYDGLVRPIRCDVFDYVFNDINEAQEAKIWAETTSQYGEITWHYCSAGSMEIDRYVTYNTVEDHWTFGKQGRTAGTDAGAVKYPIKVTVDGLIYEHEVLQDRGTEVPYLEGGPAEIGDGDNLMTVHRLVPDENTLGDVTVTFFTAFSPTDAEVKRGPYTLEGITPCASRRGSLECVSTRPGRKTGASEF